MDKKRKHRQSLRILIVPDDQDEPKSLTISMKKLKILKVLGVLLALHVIVGFIIYLQYFRIARQNNTLIAVNKQLEENNQRIYKLAEEFKELENSQTKIRQALGLGEKISASIESDTNPIQPYLMQEPERLQPSPSISAEPPPSAADIRSQLGFIRRAKSVMHDLEKNVPTFLPTEGVLTSRFSSGNQGPERRHYGIDIASARGAVVCAAADGVVLFAGWTHDLGNLMVLYHGNGFITYYGHNQQFLLERNALVRKGDPIATVGNSGLSSAPHLHFEIWKDGQPLNPTDFLLAYADAS